MSNTAFERYAPFIQEYIYRKNWADLREVQVEACDAILDSDNHVIIASGTASGKTEAAFFPILTVLDQKPPKSIGVMYIGPLKALINDQFERLSGLLEESNIPVWPWHGDISQSLKKRALKEARGILQITPESLEAMLMLHPGEVNRLFSDLQFVIIDEIHALMGTDRGMQVTCLLARMEKIAGCMPRRIGLSATLNDYGPAMNYLEGGSKRVAVAVGTRHLERTISLCVESFVTPEDAERAISVEGSYNEFIYENCHNKKCLIFTNSRKMSEQVIVDMKELAEVKHERDVFFVHHGSISAEMRHEAETALRENTGPTVTAATLTLELGIDIGDLDLTIQLGTPFSCASFVQRLGRSGRRSGKSQMMFVEKHYEKYNSPLENLPWDLLRIIAIIQLYLEERWVEPSELKPKPFSLLAHQTLSTLMTYGELSPADLANNVLTLPAFQGTIDQDEYRALLRHMVANDYLQRLESGGLIVGLKGERLTNYFSFYAVFKDEQAYHVFSDSGEIGTLDVCPAMDEVFVLAGKPWKVKSVDEEKKKIYVEAVKNKRVPNWSGGAGANIHSKIVQRMKQVLSEDTKYPYLRPNALRLLEESRKIARETKILQSNIISNTDGSFFLCPWVGSKELRTIGSLLKIGLKGALEIHFVTVGMHFIQINTGLSSVDFVEKIKAIDIEDNNPDLVLSARDAPPMIDKYDALVSEELLREAFFYNSLDVKNAIIILKQIE